MQAIGMLLLFLLIVVVCFVLVTLGIAYLLSWLLPASVEFNYALVASAIIMLAISRCFGFLLQMMGVNPHGIRDTLYDEDDDDELDDDDDDEAIDFGEWKR